MGKLSCNFTARPTLTFIFLSPFFAVCALCRGRAGQELRPVFPRVGFCVGIKPLLAGSEIRFVSVLARLVSAGVWMPWFSTPLPFRGGSSLFWPEGVWSDVLRGCETFYIGFSGFG